MMMVMMMAMKFPYDMTSSCSKNKSRFCGNEQLTSFFMSWMRRLFNWVKQLLIRARLRLSIRGLLLWKKEENSLLLRLERKWECKQACDMGERDYLFIYIIYLFIYIIYFRYLSTCTIYLYYLSSLCILSSILSIYPFFYLS